MKKSNVCYVICGIALAFCLSFSCCVAQEASAAKPDAGSASGANSALPTAAPQVRRLAPYVMKKIDPYKEIGKVFSRHDIVELLKEDPSFDFAKDVTFRKDVWFLEFEFKPIRMVACDFPTPGGSFVRKNVWYMIYKVKNPGKALHPVKDDEDNSFKVDTVDKPINFTPMFILESFTSNDKDKGKKYWDCLNPIASDLIRRREDPARKFLNSVEICQSIPVGEERWGVATWTDIDPKTKSFNIYVYGLTNAYRWKDDPESAKKTIIPGRIIEKKVLQLNFWRPGDEFDENEKEIIFGRPGDLDYLWIYM